MSNVHNPDNVDRPGNGYRFLDEDEYIAYAAGSVQLYMPEKLRDSEGMWIKANEGMLNPRFTYRTNLTREQLYGRRI